MWKLKIAEGGSPWLRTTNNHVGRQFWEFDPNLGTPDELAAIEEARKSFTENRFSKKHSSDLLMRLQVADLSTTNGANYLIPSARKRDQVLSAIEEASGMDFSNLDERRAVTKIAMKLRKLWGKCS